MAYLPSSRAEGESCFGEYSSVFLCDVAPSQKSLPLLSWHFGLDDGSGSRQLTLGSQWGEMMETVSLTDCYRVGGNSAKFGTIA